MKTKDRILVTSLALFNELGEPNVTTVDISNEMEISPGNLYYHYRNKDDIIEHIVSLYDHDISRVLNIEQSLGGLVEHWLFLKVIAEKNWHYRFIFRDFENLASKYKNVTRKLRRIQAKLQNSMREFIHALCDETKVNQFPYVEAQSDNMATILQGSLGHHIGCQDDVAPPDLLSHTCFQTLLILWPWLPDEDQALLTELSTSY